MLANCFESTAPKSYRASIVNSVLSELPTTLGNQPFNKMISYQHFLIWSFITFDYESPYLWNKLAS